MLEFLHQRDSASKQQRKPRSLSRTEVSHEKLRSIQLMPFRSDRKQDGQHTLRLQPSQSRRRNSHTSRGHSSTGLLTQYQRLKPSASPSNRTFEKPLMEKNYNEEIIRRKLRENEEKEAHKIVFMKALSSYKKLANSKHGQTHQPQRLRRVEDDLDKKREALYMTLETNKYKIVEEKEQTSKQLRQKLSGRAHTLENDMYRLRLQQERKLEELAERQKEKRHADRLRYEREQQERRQRQRIEYEESERRRRAEQRRIMEEEERHKHTDYLQQSHHKQSSIIPKTNESVLMRSDTYQPERSMEMPAVDISKTNHQLQTSHNKQPPVQSTIESRGVVPPKPSPKHQKPSIEHQLQSIAEIKTYDRAKESSKVETKSPLPTKKEPVQEIKKAKDTVPKISAKPKQDYDDLESIVLDAPKSKQPPKAPSTDTKPPNILQPQSKPPLPPSQVKLPAQPTTEKAELENSDDYEDIDEMKKNLNLVGETIGHGTRDLRGIDIGWMTPCFFLYRKFYQLRETLLRQYADLLKSGDATQQEIHAMAEENGKIRASLERMSQACLKRTTDQRIKDKVSEKFEQPVNQHLYRHMEDYIKEVSAKDDSLSPEHLLKVKLHLLEMLNSLLIVQHFEGKNTEPLTSEELNSAETRKNLDKILKMHLIEMRRNCPVKL